jgi:hypothetical protein
MVLDAESVRASILSHPPTYGPVKVRQTAVTPPRAARRLVLRNAWGAASAGIVAETGFSAVASASAAISAMLGYPTVKERRGRRCRRSWAGHPGGVGPGHGGCGGGIRDVAV